MIFENNLIEFSHDLELLINDMEMQSKQLIINQILNCYLILKLYQIIEYKECLFFRSSNDTNSQNYLRILIISLIAFNIFHIQPSLVIILKNSLNQQLPNTSCIFISKIIKEESYDLVGKQAEQTILQFDQKEDDYQIQKNMFMHQIQKSYQKGFGLVVKGIISQEKILFCLRNTMIQVLTPLFLIPIIQKNNFFILRLTVNHLKNGEVFNI
ncbi:unnamed protein product [Paramecium primaurelia]|uniref:Uncharacterized protein n=1 Tax=Paramecium primaurelia TaxID=5886 RepID=A0A8S1KS15_PARPR|nr:unnamed protein product [Paramecium primaurelia]